MTGDESRPRAPGETGSLSAWLEQVKAMERELLGEASRALADLERRLSARTSELQAERAAHARLRKQVARERDQQSLRARRTGETSATEVELRSRVEALQREQSELRRALALAQHQLKKLQQNRSYRLVRALAKVVRGPRTWLKRGASRAESAPEKPIAPYRQVLAVAPEPSRTEEHAPEPQAVAGQTFPDSRPLFVVCVSTVNRLPYLQRFVETFLATRSARFRWALVVGDDGSTDGSLEYLRGLRPAGCRVVVLENKRRGIAGQVNTMFRVARALGFDFCAKCDDDVFFLKPGWDSLYFDAATKSGFPHLVYHNQRWKPARHEARSEGLVSRVSALECMGCFYTLSPAVLDRVGFFDVLNFPVRGHAHIDWTVRCCRAGFNQAPTLWDVDGSEDYVTMWPREGYLDLTDWKSEQIKKVLGPEERARRMAVIQDEKRLFIPDTLDDPSRARSRFHLWPADVDLENVLLALPHFTTVSGLASRFDAVFVLNLEHDIEKWALMAEALSRASIPFERSEAVDGNQEAIARRWRGYNAEGLILPLERQLNRRLIQSPGAWAYLLSKECLLSQAKERRLVRFLALDDDAMLHADLQALAAEAWKEVPQDWKLMYLGCTQTDWAVAVEVSPRLYRPGMCSNGSYAYGLHASVYDQVLEGLRRFEWPYDSGPLREVERANTGQTVAFRPNLIIADVSRSAIRADRDMQDFAVRTRWDLASYLPRRFLRAPSGEHQGHCLGWSGLVSVLLVCQDDESTLADTLASLRFQTHGKLELLALDNASEDRTVEVLRRARQLDPRLRVFRALQRMPVARGLGLLLKRCRGEFVAFQPCRAVALPGRLEALLERLQAVPEANACLGCVVPIGQPAPGDLCSAQRLLRFAESHASSPPEFPAEGIMLRRTVTDRLGGFWPTDSEPLAEYLERLRLLSEPESLVTSSEVGLLWCRAVGRAEVGSADYAEFHREIAKRQRPAHVAVEEAGLELHELG